MGDRAHAVIKHGDEKIYLYTHWGAASLPSKVRDALKRVPGRWTDPAYLARAIFSQMIKDDIMEETGFGISASPCGEQDRDIVVDIDAQTVSGRGRSVSFATFVKQAGNWESRPRTPKAVAP